MRTPTLMLAALLPATAAAEVILVKTGESLRRAVERARSASGPRIIELASGRHEVSEPLRLTAEDDGLTVRGPAEGKARVVGSVRIAGWRLVDRAKGVWEAPLPASLRERPVSHVLWDGRGLRRARTPDVGWLETTERFGKGLPFSMSVSKGVLKPGWERRRDVYVVCLQKWAGFRLPIRSVDAEGGRVTLSLAPPPHRQEARNRFWIENAPEALDSPGEWYADRPAGVLRVIPPAGGDIGKAEVTASGLPTLLRLTGCAGVTIRGLSFGECGDDFLVDRGEIDTQAAAARRGAVRLEGCRDCAIEGCEVSEACGYAIDIGLGCRNCTVSRCELHDLGAGGVRIGEMRPETAASARVHGHTVADCLVRDYGRRYPGAVGLVVFQASENRLLHNEVRDAPYTGISVGWTWGYKESPCRANLVEGNRIHRLGRRLMSDLGGVYLLGPQAGTTVRRNWISDLRCFEYGAWGLYTDEGSTGVILEQNIVVRCEKAGFHQHFGRDNVVRGNLFAACGEGTVRRSREEDHLSFRFEGNVVVSDTPRLLHARFGKGGFTFERNLYSVPTPEKATWAGQGWAAWQAKGQDRGSVVADALLLDPARPERGLRRGSPAEKIGFEMPDPSSIGIRPVR